MATKKQMFCYYCRKHIVLDCAQKAWIDPEDSSECWGSDTKMHTPYKLWI